MRSFRVVHRTDYHYGLPMADGFTVVRLQPRATDTQTVVHAHVDVTPAPDEWHESTDAFGNRVVHFAVHHPHQALSVVSTIDVELRSPAAPTHDVPWRSVAAAAPGLADIAAYLAPTAQTPRLAALAALTDMFTPDAGIVSAVHSLCRRIFTEFVFDPTFTDVTTPLADVLAHRRGVCQDFAHTAVAALRSVGVPARYVSGYIETEPPPGMPRLVGVDASHAWCSVWAGELGWLDFDPTNDQMPPRRHVTVGWGRDYDDVAPVRGVVIGPGSSQSLTVSVDVAETTPS